MEELKEKYWQMIRRTRKSGRIAQSVIVRVEESWNRFDEDVIQEALRIHTSRCPGKKENYTGGIMRNLQRQKDTTGKITADNQFSQFQQNSYDYEALEREILAN